MPHKNIADCSLSTKRDCLRMNDTRLFARLFYSFGCSSDDPFGPIFRLLTVLHSASKKGIFEVHHRRGSRQERCRR